MKLEIVPPSTWADRLILAWNDLLDQSSEPSVFLTPEWIGAWWNAYGQEGEARLFAARDQAGRLLGLAPLYRRRLGLAGFSGPPVIGTMGDEEVGSEYLGILSRPGEERALLLALGEALEGEWALFDFQGLRATGSLQRLIPEILGARAPRRVHRERIACSVLALPGDYEAYLASLGQKFRSTLRYRTNKLVKNFGVRLVRTDGEEELEAHLDRLFTLHQQRWLSEGRTGSFYSPRMRAFYRDMSLSFLRRGWLRFYHLEVDGIIRASQFGFAYRGVLHSLQEAFDHSFHPPGVGGVGVVLRGLAIRESIDEGLKAYDFLGGVEEFKTRWGTGTDYTHRVRIGAPGTAGRLAFAATAGVRKTKDWGKHHLPGWFFNARETWRNWQRSRRVQRLAAGSKEGPA